MPSAGKLCQSMSERGSVGCQILVFTLPVCEIAQTGSQLDYGGQTDGDHGNQSEAQRLCTAGLVSVARDHSWGRLKKKTRIKGRDWKIDSQSNKERKGQRKEGWKNINGTENLIIWNLILFFNMKLISNYTRI